MSTAVVLVLIAVAWIPVCLGASWVAGHVVERTKNG
jgi:hypothetical protein